MKKIFFMLLIFACIANLKAQVLTNFPTSPIITNSNVMLDGSTLFSTEAGAGAYMGKGIIIPSVDLVNFEFDLSYADGTTFPTYFDGMIVYNNATGTTLTTGNRSSTATAVTPGFYFFFNPNGATNGNVKAGVWKQFGGGDGSGSGATNPDGSVDMKIGNNTYKTYTYGTTTWMVENSREGTAYYASTYGGTGGGTNGKYYTWAQANQANNACPAGWHLPTVAESENLITWLHSHPTHMSNAWWFDVDSNALAGMYWVGWKQWNRYGAWWIGTQYMHIWTVVNNNKKMYGYMNQMQDFQSTAATTVRCVKD